MYSIKKKINELKRGESEDYERACNDIISLLDLKNSKEKRKDILKNYLQKNPHKQTLKTISGETGISIPTLHRYLRELKENEKP